MCTPSDGLRFICGPEASEDLVRLPGTRWLIASGMNVGRPAHLYLIDTQAKSSVALFPLKSPQSPGGSEAEAFLPLDDSVMKLDRALAPGCERPPDLARISMDGLALRSGRGGVHVLYAANHGDRMAIEMFEVDATGPVPRVRWVGCAPLPAGTLPNAVTALPGDGLLVTSFYDPSDPTSWERMARGEQTGRLLEWHPATGFHDVPGGALSGANGVETTADGSLAYVSAWSARKLVIFSRRNEARREIPLDFMPDNIHRLADGSLLVAGQATSVESIEACGGSPCPRPWVVARVDPIKGTVRRVLTGAGTDAVNYACSALVVDDTLYVTARGDRRIGYTRWPEPKDR
jgi:hypothetical protein